MSERMGLALPESVPAAPVPEVPDRDAVEAVRTVGVGGNATVHEALVRGVAPADGDGAGAAETGGPDGARRVALKEPHGDVAGAESVRERFRAEAEAWGRVDDHPHVATLAGAGTDPRPWLAVEYADAGDLRDRASDRREGTGGRGDGDGATAWALWVGVRVAGAVAAAHDRGVVHADLTPDNVLFRSTPGEEWAVPLVTDWGVGALLAAEADAVEGLSPRYGAPEQFDPERFGDVGPATDVYALGASLYEALTGRPPFTAPPGRLRTAVTDEPPPPVTGVAPDRPAVVDDVLDRALAKRPVERYDSMAAFGRALADAFGAVTGRGVEFGVHLPDGRSDGPLGAGTGTDTDGTAAAGAAGGDVSDAYDRALSVEAEGFLRVSEGHFARREPGSVPEAWRRGLTLADVRAGLAVERPPTDDPGDGRPDDRGAEAGDRTDADPGDPPDAEGRPEGGDRGTLAAELLARLRGDAGTPVAVLGPPGSGKSTVCKQVACEWYDRDLGPVYYRGSGQAARFDDPAVLARELARVGAGAGADADGGPALVVVEDAVRPPARAVFEVLDRVGDGVRVLVDARESEWAEADLGGGGPGGGGGLGGPGGAGRGRDPRRRFETVHVPRPDADEHRRFVEAFEENAEIDVDVDPEALRTDVREATDEAPRRGELFYLMHRLSRYAAGPEPTDEGPTTGLEAAVEDLYADLAAAGDRAVDVGVAANLLNAAGRGVAPGHLYAVAPDAPTTVADAVDAMRGLVLFPREDDDRRATYPTVHGAWSAVFLERLVDIEGEADARTRVGVTLERVLGLAVPDRRERVEELLYGDAPVATRVAAAPDERVARTLEAVFSLARERPKFAALLGDADGPAIDVPRRCESVSLTDCTLWLGRAFSEAGEYDRAEANLRRLPTDGRYGVERALRLSTVAYRRGDPATGEEYARQGLDRIEHGEDRTLRAEALTRIGRALKARGEYERARESLTRAATTFREVDDRRRLAETLNELGLVAFNLGEFDTARRHHREGLELAREVGDRAAESDHLANLGGVARKHDEYDRAREYARQALEIKRELGRTRDRASVLGSLGIIEQELGNYSRAARYHERSIELKRQVGDRLGELNSMMNLGIVAQRRGDEATARTQYERALEAARDVGDRQNEGRCLGNLGTMALESDDYDRAGEYFERALEVFEEIGDRWAEALAHGSLGRVALKRGNLDRAREYARRAEEMFDDLGDDRNRSGALETLGEVARERDDHATARERFREALDNYTQVGAVGNALTVLERLVDLDRETGDAESARRHCDRALALIEEADSEFAERRERFRTLRSEPG